MSSYIDNLERLKLIKLPEGKYLIDDKFYTDIEKSERYLKLRSQKILEGESAYKTEKRILYVTDYGLSFIRCCIDE